MNPDRSVLSSRQRAVAPGEGERFLIAGRLLTKQLVVFDILVPRNDAAARPIKQLLRVSNGFAA